MEDERLFNRQYLIGDRHVDLPWKKYAFGPFRVSVHPNLDMTAGKNENAEVLILGYIFDAHDPDSDMQRIADFLVRRKSYEELEHAMSRYTGRYVVLMKRGNEVRLYPDAVGQRSCCYGYGWAGSQPGLIGLMAEIRKGSAEHVFFSRPHSLSWPGTATPFEDITMLRPNHYLDLAAMRSTRFWPKTPIVRQDVYEAAEKIVRLISTGMAGAHKRYKLWLALTAGHDSRVIFTSTKELHRDMEFFIVRDENTPPPDVAIPPRLCSAYNLAFRAYPYVNPDREWLALYDTNVCHMVWGPSRKKSKTYDLLPPNIMVVKGHVPSAGRATLYQDGYRYKNITPELLSSLLGYRGNPVAAKEFGNWLDAFPGGFEENLLDIFCLENRGGAWGSMECTGSDTNYQVFSPYNCRDVIENQLSVDRAYCIHPHRLNHIMADLRCPEISHIPMNPKTWTRRIWGRGQYIKKCILRK